jgi:hypothetical protein
MTYELRRAVLGSKVSIPLSKDEYDALVRARTNLRSLLFIEEQFDLVLNNHVELETDLLSMAVRWMVVINPDYGYMQRERNLIVNRRLLNLLSACRGYLDHAPHHINTLRVTDGELSLITSSDFRRYTSDEYDAFLGYRAMEALRNYTQHAGFPFAVTYDSAWEGEGDTRRMRFTAKPYIDVTMLGKSFKAETLKELEGLGKKVPIMPMVRQYVASLGALHEKLRKALLSNVGAWESAVLEAIGRFKKVDPDGKTIGLVAAKVVENGVWEEQHPLLSEPMEYRRALEKRNRGLETLARRYVSSECPSGLA